MFDLEKITRPNVWSLKPYSSARDEYSGLDGVFLDANENPYGNLNRYPDPYQRKLKHEITLNSGIETNKIFIGNGSDEIIDLIFRIFCSPSIDKALTFSPTYGMYDIAADLNDIELIKVQLNNNFDVDYQSIVPFFSNQNLKLIIICSPNNPTGNCQNFKVIEKILTTFNGIVLVDEAYIDFSDSKSFIQLIDTYPNLVVSHTMSKAWGLAAARIGIAFSNSKLINLLNKVKPPYNVSELNQRAAIEAIQNKERYIANKNLIQHEKKRLYKSLLNMSIITKVFPSDANFFLIKTLDADFLYNYLTEKKIIVRNRDKIIDNCIRITVGNKEENDALLTTLKQIKK